MSLPRVQIDVTLQKGTHQRSRKTRRFSAYLLGAVTADHLWDLGGGGGDVHRPVWIALATSVGETKPVISNLRAGRPAKSGNWDRFEVPRSSAHRWITHDVPAGQVTVAYLPELFHLQLPEPFTDDLRFILAPNRSWIEQQAALLASDFGTAAEDAARGALFAAYLDRRTSLPLLRDLRFHLQVYRAALGEPWTSRPLAMSSTLPCDLDACHLDTPLTCAVDAQTLVAFLTAQTQEFYRRHSPAPSPPPKIGQLALPFGLA